MRIPGEPSIGRAWRAASLIPRCTGQANAAENALCPLKLEVYCPRKSRGWGETMSLSNQLQIDSLHCRAICDEIGERLQFMLHTDATDLPAGLQILIDRLAEQDREQAPSIVPDLDEMPWQPATAPHTA